MSTIRILIADDHMLMRMGIAALFTTVQDMEIVGEARNGRQAVELADALRPDVVIMDLVMPELAGSEATRLIHEAHPEIKIVSNPVGAEIFPGSEKIERNSKSIGTTPKMVTLTTPGMTSLRLRKAGYRDTLVNFYVAPVSEINLDITMEHLTDFDEIKKQEEWYHQRKVSYIGKVLMGSAIAPVLMGSLLLYLGQQEYADAEDIKNELKMPSAAKGANFNEKIKKNKDLVDTGDRYSIIGGSLIGTGIVVFGLGLFLTF